MGHQYREPESSPIWSGQRVPPDGKRTTVEPRLISDGHWTDKAGAYWQIRGRRASFSRPVHRPRSSATQRV
jgi:hypothetical protein